MREGFEKYERIISECNTEGYRVAHRYCPQCGCISGSTTLMGCLGDKDTNRWRCGCGWVGIVHDKVSVAVKECECKFCMGEI